MLVKLLFLDLRVPLPEEEARLWKEVAKKTLFEEPWLTMKMIFLVLLKIEVPSTTLVKAHFLTPRREVLVMAMQLFTVPVKALA